jgi:hypothetical protein
MNRVYIETSGKENQPTYEHRFFEILLKKYNVSAEIIGVGGWKKLSLFDDKFRDTTKSGGQNLVIFDADGYWNEGGFEKRTKELLAEREKLKIDFELFLLPNNQSDGDLETVLENIINPKHCRLIDCYLNYENCVGQYNSESNVLYEVPLRKARIYSYIDAFPKSNSQSERFKNKGDWFFENPEYWDLDCDYLKPLETFLLKLKPEITK